jgi:hypothetical protein
MKKRLQDYENIVSSRKPTVLNLNEDEENGTAFYFAVLFVIFFSLLFFFCLLKYPDMLLISVNRHMIMKLRKR